MKHTPGIILVFLFSLAAATPLSSQESITLKKDIIVSADEVINNVISFGGEVQVEGRVKENVVVFGGRVTISGQVEDSVVGIGSNVTLTSSAHIRGDVVAFGGLLTKEPGCIIQGDTVYFKSSQLPSEVFNRGLKGILSVSFIPLILILKLISLFIWLLLAVVLAAFFPRQIAFAASQIRKSFWPVFGTGLLALVLFSGLVLASALLSLLLIGIPILLFLIFAGIVIKIFGQVILFYFFGESLARGFGSRSVSPFLAVILGVILVSIITLIPLIGFLFSFCLTAIGWGVVLRTKFGSTENWFRRRA